jgi:hypothetical protein
MTIRTSIFRLAFWTALASSAVVTFAQQERFTAVALSTGGPRSSAVAEQVIISIDRWSTGEQRQMLVDTLREQSSDELLEKLRDMPRVGHIRTPDSLGYPLHYADQQPLPDGGRRIVLATDRPIRFWETWTGSRTLDYPFTLIELKVDEQGHGEGKLSRAARIVPLDGRILLENWSVAPVQLTNVRAER